MLDTAASLCYNPVLMALTLPPAIINEGSLKEIVSKLVKAFDGVRPMARYYRLNPGNITHVMAGKESPTVRRALGLPYKRVEVEACADCGEGHTVGWCVKDLGEPKRPRPKRDKPAAPATHVRIHKTNVALAASSIRRHMGPADIALLIKELSK